MASGFVKLCTAALAGSIIGLTYEKWPVIESSMITIALPNLFASASADSSLIKPPPKVPSGDDWDRASKIVPIDPKVSAENFRLASRFGLPSKDNLRVFNDFVLSYDRRLRSPIWVIEHLTPTKLSSKNGSRKYSKFKEDSTLHEYFRATLNDFKGAHYDRGHMAAAANHKTSQDAMDQTFILSNISPQEKYLNQGTWERLESYVRWKANRSRNLYVVTGPLYLPKRAKDGNMYVIYRVIGNNNISVPTHYFKVFLAESEDGRLSMEAFVMPNDDTLDNDKPLDFYRMPKQQLNSIERASGVILFDLVDRDKVDMPDRIPSNFKPKIYDNLKKDKLPLPA